MEEKPPGMANYPVCNTLASCIQNHGFTGSGKSMRVSICTLDCATSECSLCTILVNLTVQAGCRVTHAVCGTGIAKRCGKGLLGGSRGAGLRRGRDSRLCSLRGGTSTRCCDYDLGAICTTPWCGDSNWWPFKHLIPKPTRSALRL